MNTITIRQKANCRPFFTLQMYLFILLGFQFKQSLGIHLFILDSICITILNKLDIDLKNVC